MEECWTLHLQDISPTRHFAYYVDSSPTQCEHKRMKMCDIHCVPKTIAEMGNRGHNRHGPKRFYFGYFTLCMSSSWFRLQADFYRATSAVLGIVIRSVGPSVFLSVRPYVCHTRALWLIQRTYQRYFYTTWNGDHVNHLNFGGHNHKLRLSSSLIGGEMCRRNVHVVGELSSRRNVL